MMQPILAAFFGGWEIVLILAMLLGLGLFVTVIVGVIVLATRSSQPRTVPPAMVSPANSAQPRGLEEELRTLGRLKEQGLVTEEEFNQKRKTVLGL